jgi:ParB-like nuclease domain
MTIKGRHNRIAAENVPDKLLREIEARATRRDLFSARFGASNWVLAYVQPDRIDPNPNQPRRQIERSALEELKQSIAERGILQPLLGARSVEGRVRLIAGHRRLQASKELGLARVPVVLVDLPTSLAGHTTKSARKSVKAERMYPPEYAPPKNCHRSSRKY